jgi:hypothetical protein
VVVKRDCYFLCRRSQRSQSVLVQEATGSWSDKLPILKLMCALPAFHSGPAFPSGTALASKTAKLHEFLKVKVTCESRFRLSNRNTSKTIG